MEAANPDFTILEGLKRSPLLTLSEEADLYFALGKMYSDIGNDDAAFLHYAFGNQAWQKLVPYDAIAHRENVKQLIAATPAHIFAACDGAQESDRPVLIVGMPRSGIAFVEQMLASHSEIDSAGELE